ncbi:MAG: hypothetical protein ABI390_11575 [Daejeonella sp.]
MLKKACYYITHWETWHWLAKYIPIMPVWAWYCIRSRSLWFFTPSNPTLTFGGFLGETKREMYEQLPPETYPSSVYISPKMEFECVENVFHNKGLKFPVAVKPDAGMMGFMFRKMDNADQLLHYHKSMPVDYIIQDMIDYPMEVSVFYYRFPDQQQGTITGFLKKEYLEVIGNGASTLEQLIDDYDRVSLRLEEIKSKFKDRLEEIIPQGERVCLSYALNLSRGGKLISLAAEKDSQLLKVFDDLSHYSKSFYYGRYDIKCKSVEDLKQGKNYSILEFNGSGAEPHHVYGNGNTLFQAYGILLHHWKMLFLIARINNKKGIKYWNFRRGLEFSRKAKKHFKALNKLDLEYQYQ